jgi:hypothetical protein
VDYEIGRSRSFIGLPGAEVRDEGVEDPDPEVGA